MKPITSKEMLEAFLDRDKKALKEYNSQKRYVEDAIKFLEERLTDVFALVHHLYDKEIEREKE